MATKETIAKALVAADPANKTAYLRNSQAYLKQIHSLLDEAKAKMQDPQIQKILAGVGAAVVGLVVISVLRSRKRSNDLKEIQRILAGRA